MKSHWLPALRAKLGLSQAAMARELGISRSRVWQIEHWGGTLRPTRLREVWTQYRRQLRRLGYSQEDLYDPQGVERAA